MISRLLISLGVLVLFIVAGSFVVFAVWDVPVEQKEIEKPIDNSKFLEK
jgi:hypothetical protein